MSDTTTYSDFWLEKERYTDYIDPNPDNTDEVFSIDLIRLASTRRIISNYVDILTGTSVPVYFKSSGDSYNIGGKEIYISTDIKRRKDFDKAVGLALHEAAHTLLTDFGRFKSIPFNVPKHIWDFCQKNGIRKTSIERFIKTIVGVIEDWYIDDWVMARAPGYIGYYEASYNDCFNTPVIDQLLLGNDYRFPSLASYEFRIINFPNPLTDLQALPGLDSVAEEVSISTISRLETTKDRISAAFKVVDIVLQNIQSYHDYADPLPPGSVTPGRINVGAFFGETSSSKKDNGSEKSDTDRTIKDVADVLAKRPKTPDDENKPMVSQIGASPDKAVSKETKHATTAQMQYVHGNVEKQELESCQKTMLDLIEKHGIILVYVPVAVGGNDAALKVGCIVVKKMTIDLINAGSEVFPMASSWKDMDGKIRPKKDAEVFVQKGIQLGSKLGRRLLLRRETNLNREIRKRRGKLNRRLLYSAGFDAEDVFEKVTVLKYPKGNLHMSIDASTSMSGEKWGRTMTMCVAVCKAASMVDNIHVTVSFRATKRSGGVEMPYIVQAYDSKKDKFSKVKQLFGYLSPCGCTPEGLAFGAIMDLFTETSPDEEDRYFLNISDGEPYFTMCSPLTHRSFHYGDGNGVEHTRSQINKIRRQGVNILSYYVQDGRSVDSFLADGHNTLKNFRTMYGKDARYIDVNSVVDLATTINELFLRDDQKTT